ncbi:MAG: DUF362 domain-containing protein [Calditrichaeota bacterium]|nr:DUF362 domain-containing protein [Calditrichota bacterium]RQV98444.1 MAG: DUF362 domain-containing protein [Calditrichota bacterium]
MPKLTLSGNQDKSRVVLIRRQDLFDQNKRLREEVATQMLDEAVMALVGITEPVEAWKKIVRPGDILGVKSNVWRYLPTPPELERAISRRALDAGVKEENISIQDRGILSNPVFLNATALINIRPMRTHHWSGVGTLLKNYIMFVEKPYTYHGDSCADLAAIWKFPVVKDKTRLNILVMFTPLFHSVGPHNYNPEYTWNYNGLLAGFDPVAVDAVGVQIIAAKRRDYFGEDRPLNPPAKHIQLADTRHKLGTANPDKIELIRMGWARDRFI